MRNCFHCLLWHFPGRPSRTPDAVPQLQVSSPLPKRRAQRTSPTWGAGISPETLLTPRHLFPPALPHLPPAAPGAHGPATASAAERGCPGGGAEADQASGLHTQEPSPGQARPGPARPNTYRSPLTGKHGRRPAIPTPPRGANGRAPAAAPPRGGAR